MGAAWSWPCSDPAHTQDHLVTEFEEVLDVLRGACECLNFSNLEIFCLFECHIRSWLESILKSWGSIDPH